RRLLVSAGLVVGPAAPRLGPLTDADAARIVAAVVLAEADVAASSRRPLRTGVPGPVVVVIGQPHVQGQGDRDGQDEAREGRAHADQAQQDEQHTDRDHAEPDVLAHALDQAAASSTHPAIVVAPAGRHPAGGRPGRSGRLTPARGTEERPSETPRTLPRVAREERQKRYADPVPRGGIEASAACRPLPTSRGKAPRGPV